MAERAVLYYSHCDVVAKQVLCSRNSTSSIGVRSRQYGQRAVGGKLCIGLGRCVCSVGVRVDDDLYGSNRCRVDILVPDITSCCQIRPVYLRIGRCRTCI